MHPKTIKINVRINQKNDGGFGEDFGGQAGPKLDEKSMKN